MLLLVAPQAAGGERTPPGRHSAEAVAWSEAVGERTLRTVAGPPAIRYALTPGEAHLFFIRAEYAEDALPAQPPAAGREDDGEGRRPRLPELSLPPEPVRRVLCRVPIVFAEEAGADEVEVEEIAELGAYPHRFELLDGGERVLLVYEAPHDETGDAGEADEGDPHEGADATRQRPGRILRLGEHTEAGWQWRELYHGPPQLVLAGVLPQRDEALLVEPGEERFANHILRLPLSEPEAEPVLWTHGLYPACADEFERYLVVTRAGTEPSFQRGFMVGPVDRPDEVDEDARLRYPPTVVTVSLDDPEDEREVVSRQDFVQVRFIHDDIAYADVVSRFPAGRRQHPALQGIHSLAYFDLGDDEAPTRVPMSEESSLDYQLLGPLPRHGILYLRNTHVNRYLHLFTGDTRTLEMRELSPLTAEFVLSPDAQTLYFLEYTSAVRPPFNPQTRPTRIRALDISR